MANPRVTAAMKRAVTRVMADLPNYTDPAEFIADVCEAVICAEDDVNVRWVVATDEHGGTVYGPYASPESARNALKDGWLASQANVRGRLFALTPAPRAPKRLAPTKPKAKRSAKKRADA